VKIAIIGSGISSLTAGYLLSNLHDIQVFEADNRIGGHTATKHIEFAGESHAIDTGFIVYNDWTYPNFIQAAAKAHQDAETRTNDAKVKAQAAVKNQKDAEDRAVAAAESARQVSEQNAKATATKAKGNSDKAAKDADETEKKGKGKPGGD
jgi:phytoene dehydrogenase-like protein